MATKDTSWMPAPGRHSVSIGTSLGRALKARKGAPQTKKSNLPDRDFYSFRYNFKPESIDSSKPGTIDIKRGKDSTSVTVERSSAQAGENHIFIGNEQPAKEWECVLVYDEETGTFVLEKLDSFVTLKYDKKTTPNLNRLSTSPLPPPPYQPSTSREALDDLDLDAEFERNLDPDAEGEPDNDFDDIVVQVPPREEEEEEEEEIFIPPRAPSPKPKPQRPAKVTAPQKSRAAPSKVKAKGKRELANSLDVEEESLEFGRPAQQTKRPRPLPPSEGLALPGSFPVPSPLASPPPTQPVPASDSEEDWDEVAAAPALTHSSQPDVYMEDGDGDDDEMLTAFEAEMNQTLEEEEEEDFLAAAVGSDPDEPPLGRPISLNQFAGGEPSQDEDDYSSSEDSDDE